MHGGCQTIEKKEPQMQTKKEVSKTPITENLIVLQLCVRICTDENTTLLVIMDFVPSHLKETPPKSNATRSLNHVVKFMLLHRKIKTVKNSKEKNKKRKFSRENKTCFW